LPGRLKSREEILEESEKYWHRKFDQLAIMDIPDWQRSSWWYAYIVDNQRKYLEQNLRRHYPRGLKNLLIADLGCGPGLYFDRLSKPGCNMVGLDFSLKALKVNPHSDNRQIWGLVGGDVSNLPFKPGIFDVILLFGVLQTADDPCEYIRSVSRAMKPGGMLLLTTLRQHSPWELPFWPVHILSARDYFPGVKTRESALIRSRDILLPREEDEKYHPLKRYKQKRLKGWLDKSGFHKIQFSYDGPITMIPHISNSVMIYVKAFKK